MHQILTNKLDSIKIIIGVCFKEESIIICHPPLFKLPIAPPYYQQRPRQTCFKRRGGVWKRPWAAHISRAALSRAQVTRPPTADPPDSLYQPAEQAEDPLAQGGGQNMYDRAVIVFVQMFVQNQQPFGKLGVSSTRIWDDWNMRHAFLITCQLMIW